ncbi:hypothetical protein EOT10_27815 [Streptomyces antnestii]|uniref:Uncharacterized protein n=1 Tax=Streptomyces antnestii TaxID=2494256 RepID=A0A437PDZ0_9ACTN|nr:hypothetical protein [Streptomyces sp. San01]RVU20477.1 hypothetical protein EOT10_27815 [Streptomyces sp. San01]
MRPFFSSGANLALAHLEALAKAVPDAVLGTYADYLNEHQTVASAVLEICADRRPDLWYRRADAQRGVDDLSSTSNRPQKWEEFSREGVVGFDGATEGWLIPKTVIILTMAILDAFHFKTPEVYHLSGPSMVQYIGSLGADLEDLYRAVAPKIGLPTRLVFNLVPTALMTLGAPDGECSSVDRLVEAWLAVQGTRQHHPLPSRAEDRPTFFHTRQAKQSRARTELAWAAASCPFPFHRSRVPEFCSQYDLLALDATWFVHPWGAETPLGEVGRMLRAVNDIRSDANT